MFQKYYSFVQQGSKQCSSVIVCLFLIRLNKFVLLRMLAKFTQSLFLSVKMFSYIILSCLFTNLIQRRNCIELIKIKNIYLEQNNVFITQITFVEELYRCNN